MSNNAPNPLTRLASLPRAVFPVLFPFQSPSLSLSVSPSLSQRIPLSPLLSPDLSPPPISHSLLLPHPSPSPSAHNPQPRPLIPLTLPLPLPPPDLLTARILPCPPSDHPTSSNHLPHPHRQHRRHHLPPLSRLSPSSSPLLPSSSCTHISLHTSPLPPTRALFPNKATPALPFQPPPAARRPLSGTHTPNSPTPNKSSHAPAPAPACACACASCVTVSLRFLSAGLCCAAVLSCRMQMRVALFFFSCPHPSLNHPHSNLSHYNYRPVYM